MFGSKQINQSVLQCRVSRSVKRIVILTICHISQFKNIFDSIRKGLKSKQTQFVAAGSCKLKLRRDLHWVAKWTCKTISRKHTSCISLAMDHFCNEMDVTQLA